MSKKIDELFEKVFTPELMDKNGWNQNFKHSYSVSNIKSKVMTEALKSLSKTINKVISDNLQNT